MAHLTNFSFEFFNEIFTEDASLLFLYHGAKKSKMTKNSNQGGPALTLYCHSNTVMQLAHCACARMPWPTSCSCSSSSFLLIILSFTRLWIVFTSDGKGIQQAEVSVVV